MASSDCMADARPFSGPRRCTLMIMKMIDSSEQKKRREVRVIRWAPVPEG